jgi:hypothetical protein
MLDNVPAAWVVSIVGEVQAAGALLPTSPTLRRFADWVALLLSRQTLH